MSRRSLDSLEAAALIGRPIHLLRAVKYSFDERLWLYRQQRNQQPAILVYQMGKVGSRTVYKTLMSLGLPNPIYHVHWLSPAGIQAAAERHRRAGVKGERHLRESQSLRRQLDCQPDREWRIVTLVRDPVARQISELFEQIWRHYPALMTADGSVHVEQTLAALETTFSDYDEIADKCHTWFESELKQVFGIDIFGYPFDQETGCSLIIRDRVQLLVVRLEDLDRNAGLIGRFVGHSGPVTLVKANVAESKSYAEAYRAVTTAFRLPASLCQAIYGSRYALHFYSPGMRTTFVRRWSQEQSTG